MIDLRPETTAAIDAVRGALELAQRGTGEVHAKGGRDVVTDTDIAAEDLLRDMLTRVAAGPVIGEERGGDAPENAPYWLVDPICGTRNFASGIPLFSINAALVEDGRVVIAAIGDGLTGDVLVAEQGKGAWRMGRNRPAQLSTSASSGMLDLGAWPKEPRARDKAARYAAATIAGNRWDVRCLSTTLSLAYVGTGQVAACVLFDAPASLHVAAACLLAAEAGGLVTDAGGRPWSLAGPSIVCAADDRLHEELLDSLRQNGSLPL